MIKRFIIAAILVALVLGGLSYFQFVFKPKMIAQFLAKMAPPAATVTAEPAKVETWTDRLHAIGTTTAIQGVDVAPEVGGIVTKYYFDSGKDVAKGDKLVDLDISVEQADLASNLATLKEADADFARQTDLVKKGAASQSVLDTTIAKRDSAAAAVQRVQAVIAQKSILAPFGGRLGLRHVEKGQYVSAGQSLVWLQALDPIWVDFPMPEAELGKLKAGGPLELGVDAYSGHVFSGIIQAFDARVNQDSRTLMVRGQLPNPDHKLLPGMFANVSVLAGAPKPLVTVPRTAVTYGLYGDSIWVVAEGKAPAQGSTDAGAAKADEAQLIAERRFVHVGATEGDRVAIDDGVKAGEQVITSGQLKLQPEGAIKIDNSAPLTPLPERPKP